jgi:iron complex outermembrane receptor protein
MIQGLYGSRVLLLNNGVRQEDQQWGTEHAPNMDPGLAQRITVVKGAASVQYGADALGGVVLAEAEDLPRGPGLSGEAGMIARSNGWGGGLNGMLQGGIGGWRGFGWRVQAGALPFYRELGILRASHIGNLTDLENAFQSGEPSYVAPFTYEISEPRQQVLHQLLKVETGMRTSELDQLILRP